MKLYRKYTKEAILTLWIVVNFAAAINYQVQAVLSVLFGALYYVYVTYSE